ncbi:hypothetical protein Tco_0479401 [Tanacetum coccineum]
MLKQWKTPVSVQESWHFKNMVMLHSLPVGAEVLLIMKVTTAEVNFESYEITTSVNVENLVFEECFCEYVLPSGFSFRIKCLLSNLFNHNACVAAAVAAMNSDSHDDNATVACFCVLQLMVILVIP